MCIKRVSELPIRILGIFLRAAPWSIEDVETFRKMLCEHGVAKPLPENRSFQIETRAVCQIPIKAVHLCGGEDAVLDLFADTFIAFDFRELVRPNWRPEDV